MATVGMALQLFSVTNRTNLFVYPEENGRIFYLQLSLSTKQEVGAQAQHELLLEVFGLGSPSPEITDQLQQLLRSKLATATLLNISSLLARNPLFKLTLEDVEFIRGPNISPSKNLFYQIPSFLVATLFFVYLKQNLLQFLRVMLGTATAAETDLILGPALVKEDHVSIDCTFIYNSIANTKIASIGRGIAIIKVYLLYSKAEAPVVSDDATWLTTCTNTVHPEEYDFQSLMHVKPGFDTLVVKLWTRESLLNLPSLVSMLTQSVNQTICEYALESHFLSKRLLLNSLIPDFIAPWNKLLMQVRPIAVPSISEARLQITLPSWSISSFISELTDILTELNSRLSPIAAVCENTKEPQFTLFSPVKRQLDRALLMYKDQYSIAILGGRINIQESDASEPLDRAELHSINEAMLYPHIIPEKEDVALASQGVIHRNCFILCLLSEDSLVINTYNWNPAKLEQLNYYVSRLKQWISMRQQLLKNVVHQKIGLFYHTPSVSTAGRALSSSQDVVKFTLDNMELLLNNTSPSRKNANPLEPTLKQSQSPVKRKPVNQNFDTVLMSGLPIQPILATLDPVERHGNQFQSAARNLFRIQEQQTNIDNIFSTWAITLPNQPYHRAKQVPLSQLHTVIKSSRLIHSYRAPLLLDDHANRSLIVTKDLFLTKSPPANLSSEWHRTILDGFFQGYLQYLDKLSFGQVSFIENSTPAQENDSKEQFLHKLLPRSGGLLLLRLAFEEPYLCCDLYAMLRAKTTSSTAKEAHKLKSKSAMDECNRAKELLHTSSSLYDMHVKLLSDFIYTEANHAPSYEFLLLAKSTVQSNPSPPPHSLNSITLDIVCADYEPTAPASDLFLYLAQNASTYGVKSLNDLGIHPAVTLVSSNLPALEKDTSAKYSVVVFCTSPEEQTMGVLELQVLTLRVQESKPSHTYSLLDADATEATVSNHLRTLVTLVSSHYKRDLLWKKLVGSTLTDAMSLDQFQTLLKLVVCRSIEDVDTSAKNSLVALTNLKIPWLTLLNHLLSVYGKNARVIQSGRENKEKHLILLHSSNPCLLIYFCFDEPSAKMSIYSCSRGIELTQPNLAQDEHQFLSNVINHIAYFIWKTQFIK
jgi:hypothetical protein